jgi:DNA methylase
MADKRDPLHSMCSYLGCFPPKVPRRILHSWVAPRATVLDPFCGSGTTLVESVLRGNPCIGIDRNPLAVAIALAKIQRVTADDVRERLLDLANAYPGSFNTESVPEDLRIIFHPRTLAQLAYLRGALDLSRPEDLFLRGSLLGIMHGKHRKEGGTAYLSIDMPNTFSMSPEYVRRFVRKHNLHQPPANVFSRLRERVARLLRGGPLPARVSAKVLEGDATKLPAILRTAGVERVNAIVTSPPYLGILRYGAFNWIRLWFLGHEPTPVDRLLDGTDSLDRYLSFLASFLTAAAEVLPSRAPVILVIGDVVEFGTQLKLARRVWDELAGLVPFELTTIAADRFDKTVKTTRIWGDDRKGKATPLDRYLVLQRLPVRRRRAA